MKHEEPRNASLHVSCLHVSRLGYFDATFSSFGAAPVHIGQASAFLPSDARMTFTSLTASAAAASALNVWFTSALPSLIVTFSSAGVSLANFSCQKLRV